MPKIVCKCDEILDLSDVPSKIQYSFISDVEFDNYSGMIDSEKLYMQMKNFIKCPKCKRVWFFWEGFDKEPQEYLPINKEENNIE